MGVVMENEQQSAPERHTGLRIFGLLLALVAVSLGLFATSLTGLASNARGSDYLTTASVAFGFVGPFAVLGIRMILAADISRRGNILFLVGSIAVTVAAIWVSISMSEIASEYLSFLPYYGTIGFVGVVGILAVPTREAPTD